MKLGRAELHSADKGLGAVLGGAAAGVVAGIAMLIVASVGTMSAGAGVTYPLRCAAAAVFGMPAFLRGFDAVLIGGALHLSISACFGATFAGLIRPTMRWFEAGAWGLGFGVVIWALMSYVTLPLVNPVMYLRVVQFDQIRWFALHLVFGIALGSTPALCRLVASRLSSPALEGEMMPA